jgi:hypothetical protein
MHTFSLCGACTRYPYFVFISFSFLNYDILLARMDREADTADWHTFDSCLLAAGTYMEGMNTTGWQDASPLFFSLRVLLWMDDTKRTSSALRSTTKTVYGNFLGQSLVVERCRKEKN